MQMIDPERLQNAIGKEKIARHSVPTAIQEDNDNKEYCLEMLLNMCVHFDVDVSCFKSEKGPDGDIIDVVIYHYFSPDERIHVEGDSPLTMVKELISKGHLG